MIRPIPNTTDNSAPAPSAVTPESQTTTTTTETHTIACISTFHLSRITYSVLEASADTTAQGFSVWRGYYGLVLAALPPSHGPEQLDKYLLPALGQQYENQLWNIMHWAHRHGYQYVMIDRDADIEPELPTYEADWD